MGTMQGHGLVAIAATAFMATGLCVYAQTQKITVTVENEAPPYAAGPRKLALVVQNHAGPGARIPILALSDALTAKLSGRGFQVINPYNAVGDNQNRATDGEKTPEVSALELARQLGADGLVTASVTEFLDSTVGTPPLFPRYSVRVSFSLADAGTGAAVCGDTVKRESPQYTVKQVEANRQKYLGELLHVAAEECAEKLEANPAVRSWLPSPPSPPPAPQRQRTPTGPSLTISDIDAAVQDLFGKMRTNPVFRSNYDKAQGDLGHAPLAIMGGIVDLTAGKSPCAEIGALLAAASQGVRMAFVNSGLFDAKDDALVTTITRRIVESGNSPLEDGELMTALKQHGSPDFYVVGDMMYFVDGAEGRYRLRLALHNLHTGKIVWEGVETIVKSATGGVK